MKEAMFYEARDDKSVQCNLCFHRCIIKEGKIGICRVRKNTGGKLVSLVYDRIVARHVDPIEKKPLFHFYPGSLSYSIATVGCNFRCLNCQNYSISMASGEDDTIPVQRISPEEIADDALAAGCVSIAYTYTEPTIYYELAYDTCVLASERGMKNVFVSNGAGSEQSLRHIAPYLDGINIDLKSFSDEFYHKICGGALAPVLENIALCRELGIWVEVTTLIIPGLNDSEKEIEQIASFIAGVDRDIPWHISRFYPTYKMQNRESTPVETLHMARKAGYKAGLRYVYEGNVPGRGGEDTACWSCKKALIERRGFSISRNDIKEGRCSHCGAEIAGRWS